MVTHDAIPEAARTTDEVVVRLHEESIAVAKRPLVLGTVRVEVTTRAREHLIDELLTRDHVDIQRVPIGQVITAMPDVREEGDTTVIPVVEEVIVTERRLVLKEEIRLRRVRKTERHTETVSLRSQEAHVSRTAPEARDVPTTPSTTREIAS